MAKKIKTILKLNLPAGKATPAPPVGPALGQHGLNLASFCKEYNAKTANSIGMIIPARIIIYSDKSYSFTLKSASVSSLLLKYANIKKGAAEPNKIKVGKIDFFQLKEIALIKMPDLNTKILEKAISIISGTAKSMGIQIV